MHLSQAFVSWLTTSTLAWRETFAASSPDDNYEDPLPVVIWHGLGDSHLGDGIIRTGEIANEIHPGTYVYNIHIDDSSSADSRSTFFGNLTLQIEKVCADIAADPILSTAPAMDAIGYSQGGQFLRGYIERCNKPPIRSLVTFGSQHNGISEFQKCKGPTDFLCLAAGALLKGSTWSSIVQSRLVPAQYYRNPADLESYLLYSNFLADINNERILKNTTYKENIMKLEHFVMYQFEEDTTVVPKETGWFAEVNGTEVTPLQERAIYTEDWLGLKALDRKGALKFEMAKGAHMTIPDSLLVDVYKKYFGPLRKSGAAQKKQSWLQVDL
ncbi:MAG: hypothetical protein M1818_000477 [Claussenomyces sp. TS43310]|nr:MAG: hypothetical protein M1818_000477 [Claussenomyces sp. TS43310]